ncbi:DUF4123 domain-containing protein [Gammaproteobacteria bacterium AS21]
MQDFQYPTILHCEAMKVGDSRQTRYDILVALKVKNWLSIDSAISQYMQKLGYQFLYSHEALAVNHYLERTIEHYSTVLALCDQLSEQQPISCKAVAILSREADPLDDLKFVEIDTHSIPKEVAQADSNYWLRPWINSDLKALLFAANLPSNSDVLANEVPSEKIHTYLLLDASAYIEHRGVFDLDLISDCPVMCMFTGEAAQTLKMSAPYLLDLTIDEKVYQDDGSVPHFHRRYFEKMWGENVGVFIQSSASMKDIHLHFRKFLKFDFEEKNNRFFRYWDPRVLKVHLPNLANYPKACYKFFNVPNTQQGEKYPPVTFIYEDHAGLELRTSKHNEKQAGLIDSSEQLINTKIARFNSSAYGQIQQLDQAFDIDIRSQQEPSLYEIIEQGFIAYTVQQFCLKTAYWLVEHYGQKQLAQLSISTFLAQQIPLLRQQYQLASEYEFNYALAGCYLLQMPIAEIPDVFTQHLANFALSPAQRAENFLIAIQQSANTELAAASMSQQIKDYK